MHNGADIITPLKEFGNVYAFHFSSYELVGRFGVEC